MKRTGKLTAITAAFAVILSLASPAIASARERAHRGGWTSVITDPGTTDTTDTTQTEPKADSSSQVLALHNDTRKNRGLKALSLDAKVSRYALRHSKAMANKGYLFHTSSLASVLGGRNWSIAGENVGVGPDVERVQDAFMDSAPHRKNILRSGYDHVAIGVYRDGPLVWVTVIFYG